MKRTISDLDGFAEICAENELLLNKGGSCSGEEREFIGLIIDPIIPNDPPDPFSPSPPGINPGSSGK